MSETVAKRTRPTYGYTNDDFVQLWNSCTNVEQVATKIGMPMPSCQTKAAILRKKGLHLKLFKRGRRVASIPEVVADVNPTEVANNIVNAVAASGDWEPIKSNGGSNAA